MHRRGEGDEWCVRGMWWYMGERRVRSGVWCVGEIKLITLIDFISPQTSSVNFY